MDRQRKMGAIAGLGAVALALLVVFSVWPPDVKNEEAAGAIGAVKKHQQTQIETSDVILVDEATRRKEAILYGDFLADAQKLDNISADLTLALRNSDAGMQARAAGIRSSLANVEQQIESHSNDLQARYLKNMDEALGSARALLARAPSSRQQTLESELNDLSAKVRSQSRLESADMETMSARYRNVAEQLESKADLSARVKNMEADLGSALSALEQRSALDNDAALEAVNRLESLGKNLSARDLEASFLGTRADYLASMALESRELMNARRELASFMQAKAMNDRSMEMGIKSLGNLSADLANRADKLEARAVANMNVRLEARKEIAAKIQNMEMMMARMSAGNKNLESLSSGISPGVPVTGTGGPGDKSPIIDRSRSTQRGLQAVSSQLESVRQDLAVRNNQLAVRVQGSIDRELASIDRHIENQRQLDGRLRGRDQLNASRDLANRRSLDSFHKYLQNVGRSLDASSALGARIGNRDKLAAHSQDLQARVIAARSANP